MPTSLLPAQILMNELFYFLSNCNCEKRQIYFRLFGILFHRRPSTLFFFWHISIASLSAEYCDAVAQWNAKERKKNQLPRNRLRWKRYRCFRLNMYVSQSKYHRNAFFSNALVVHARVYSFTLWIRFLCSVRTMRQCTQQLSACIDRSYNRTQHQTTLHLRTYENINNTMKHVLCEWPICIHWIE